MHQSNLGDFTSTGESCPTCEFTAETRRGLASHHSQIHGEHLAIGEIPERYGVPAEWLFQTLHHTLQLSVLEMSKRLPYTRRAITAIMDGDLGIERRSQSEHLEIEYSQMDEEALRERTRDARAAAREKYGDGAYLGEWISENPDEHREVAQAAAGLGADGRERNGMEGVTGQDHHSWRGGKSIYDAVKKQLPGPSWSTLRERTREAAGRTCEMCGKPGEAIEHRGLDVHHIVPVLAGGTNEEWNRVALCGGCHHKAEWYTRRIPEVDPVLMDDD